MDLQAAIQLFLGYLKNEAFVSDRYFRFFQHELERFAQFMKRNVAHGFEGEPDIHLLAEFFRQRIYQLSPRHIASVSRCYKKFFDFLLDQHVIEKNIGVLFPYLAKTAAAGKRMDLLQQVRELEKLVFQGKRLDRIKERFSTFKREIIQVAKDHPAITRLLFTALEQKVGQIKADVQAANDRHLNEILHTGSFLDQKELGSLQAGLAELNKNLLRLGREALKTNTFFENNQEKDVQSFQELARRLGRVEQLVGDLQVLKKQHQIELSFQVAKKLLPVIDGLEGAQAALFDVEGSGKRTQQKMGWSNRFLPFWRRIRYGLPFSVINLEQWREGLEIIRQKLLTILVDEGIQPVKSMGEAFNPHYHIAVGVEHRDDTAEGVIVGEQVVGYCRGEQVVRHAEVVVAKRAAS